MKVVPVYSNDFYHLDLTTLVEHRHNHHAY